MSMRTGYPLEYLCVYRDMGREWQEGGDGRTSKFLDPCPWSSTSVEGTRQRGTSRAQVSIGTVCIIVRVQAKTCAKTIKFRREMDDDEASLTPLERQQTTTR